ncbi:MAG: NAD-dependent epimerase/dehydratase family protein [Candidatus Omnitrophica bacterium]|nr:NAD-dependent epimerase/dehydratase family protein [Candidatus Omnitrophota bacterium]
MKNLVTGASGFIGSFIAEELVKRGEHVRALVRKTSDTQFLKSIGVELFYGNLDDSASVRKAMKGMDKVFHSAAMVGDWVLRKDAQKTNVGGTRKMLESAIAENIKRFVFVSSLAVLGMRDHKKTPSDAPRIKTGDIYADTKIDSEELVVEYGKTRNLPFTVIRPGFVFGPRDKKVVPKMVEFLSKGKYIFVGSGKNKVNMIYVENLAKAVVDASYSDKTIGQIYNITNESGMTMMDVVNMVADTWGYKKPTKHLPKNVAYFICSILEFFAKAVHAKEAPLLNKTRLKFLSLNLDFDISKIKADLGYSPKIDMAEGMKRTKAWMDKNAK